MCSLERGFSRPGTVFRALESLAMVTLEEEVKRGSLVLKVEVEGIVESEEGD